MNKNIYVNDINKVALIDWLWPCKNKKIQFFIIFHFISFIASIQIIVIVIVTYLRAFSFWPHRLSKLKQRMKRKWKIAYSLSNGFLREKNNLLRPTISFSCWGTFLLLCLLMLWVTLATTWSRVFICFLFKLFDTVVKL